MLDFLILCKLNFDIVFHLGTEHKTFSSQNKQEQTQTGIMGQVGKFAFNLSPRNGLDDLSNMISKFITNQKQQSMIFEPLDPSFEINIERTQIPGEYKFYCWVDAGNTQHLEYSWDAQGIRFIVTEQELTMFTQALQKSS